MQLLNLRLYQYRNFGRQELACCPGTNLFFGKNGQGKTNLLEAIYLLGYGRSFRSAVPKDCIQHGTDECRVDGKIEHGSLIRELAVSVSSTEEKQLLLHRKPATLAEFIGNFHALAFTQEHLKVVRGGPAERRAFLDRALLTSCPGHMQRIAAYGRALKQRNHILGSALGRGVRADRALLEAWEEKLAQEGSRLLWNRLKYVDEMKRELINPLCFRESLEITYVTSTSRALAGIEEIENGFLDRLSETRDFDEKKGFTTVGPHRDELRLLLNGRALADFGSAGQQRSSLLTLYFAQMEIHHKTQGFYPVFLMDDVEAELDNERLQAFLDHLATRTQTFLTTAKEQVLPSLPAVACRFRVSEGKIVCVKPN